MAMKPRRMTRRGFAFGNTLGTPAAKSSSINESGSRCTPVATAERPRATDRNSGTTKKIPACTRNKKKNEVTPSRSWMLCSIFGSISAASPRAMRRFSHIANRPTTTQPASTSQITGESPSHSGAPGLASHEPPRARLQDADHDQTKAGGRKRLFRPGRAWRPSRRCVVHPARQGEDHISDQHLADEHPSPRRIARSETADTHRPHSGGHRAGGRHQPVGARPVGFAEVRGDKRDDCRKDQHRAEPRRNDQPMISTVRLCDRAVVSDPHA